jgi:hypothetical protein
MTEKSENAPLNRCLPVKPVVKVFAIFQIPFKLSIFKAFMPDNIFFKIQEGEFV